MSSLMTVYARVAATYGHVDPADPGAVQRFFDTVLPTLSPEIQQAVIDELFEGTTGLPANLESSQD